MCKNSTMFNHRAKTCLLCDDYQECRTTAIKFLTVIGKTKQVRDIMTEVAKPQRTIPVIDDSMPIMTRKKLIALYKRGFSYRVGQQENPFTKKDPASFSLIYNELSRRKSLSKADIRNAIIEGLGWSYQSSKVEVSRVIRIMVTVGIAKEADSFLIFLN